MHPRRKAIYYAIILASILWMTGTITFLFFQDIEVTVQVKRRLEQPLEVSKPSASNREKQDESESKNYSSERAEKEVSKENRIESEDFVRKALVDLNHEDGDEKSITANYERDVHRDRNGPGEQGQGVTVGAAEKEKEKEGYKKHAFNQLVSDKISVHRRLKDYRHERYVSMFFYFELLAMKFKVSSEGISCWLNTTIPIRMMDL